MAEAAARVVIVSNRVPALGQARASVGGLVSALRPALEAHGGLWFGWSGATGGEAPPRLHREGAVEYATVDLTSAEVAGYYEGFCNRQLWPLMHGMPERAHLRASEFELWRGVQRRFATLLRPLLRPTDLVWVHDYHLIGLGEELRRLGWTGRLGYFHHIPIPREDTWRQIPCVEDLAASFEAYDLVGVQTARDAERLRAYVPASVRGRVAEFPIGVDPGTVRSLAARHPGDPFEARAGRRVLLGLDRLDYTKGIPDRLVAFEALLRARPALARETLLVQWSAPSRESIEEYQRERDAVAAAAGRLDAFEPAPVEVRSEVLPAETVAAALRDADVCLVTSRSDGMNLVAKEFIAAQRPEAPGVLILTDGCGAAERLTDALIVPSGDLEALRDAMARALDMSLEERRTRWEALAATVEREDVAWWARTFLAALEAAGRPPD